MNLTAKQIASKLAQMKLELSNLGEDAAFYEERELEEAFDAAWSAVHNAHKTISAKVREEES